MENPKEQIMIETGEWLMKESDRLITEYRNCRSEYEKVKVIKKMESLTGKIKFEMNEIERMKNGN